MKVTHIVAESTKKPVSEAPVSGLAQFGKKVLAKTAAKVGARDFAAGVAGNVDTGAEANELRTAWQNHQGATGGSMKANDPVEFKNWLMQNGFKDKGPIIDKAIADASGAGKGAVAPGGPFNKKVLDAALLQIVKNSKKASPQGDGADQTAAKAQASAGQPTSKTPAVKDPLQGGAGGGIPKGIQDQLDQLTPSERDYLMATLGKGGAPKGAGATA